MSIVEFPPKAYAITEAKKSELDGLQIQVLEATREVQQYQAIVDSLSAKSNEFEEILQRENNKQIQALSNKNLIDQIIHSAKDLKFQSNATYNEAALANVEVNKLAKKIKVVIDQLIFSTEVINKLANLIAKKKALNPIISDDLVEKAEQSGKDANKAIALTLTALEACYASVSSSAEAQSASTLQYVMSKDLLESLEGKKEKEKPEADDKNSDTDNDNNAENKKEVDSKSVLGLLNSAYDKAVKDYNEALSANDKTEDQLNKAKSKLDRATVKLQSLESGYAAARAAALAS